MLARIGQHFGPIDGHGDPTDLEHPAVRRQLDGLGKAALQERAILLAKGANRIVVGMGIPAEQPHRHAVVRRPLDLPAGENSRGVAVDEQPQHHPWRVLRVARAPLVDSGRAQIQFFQRVHHKVHQVSRRHPLPQIRRQQKGRVVVNVHKSRGHIFSTRHLRKSWRISPTGC
jgi:hypothetical protein